MKAVHRVMMPKQVVIEAKKMRGPMKRMSMVEGSWKTMLLTLKTKIATE